MHGEDMYTIFHPKNLMERNHLGDLGVDGV
jgi:hypothetical protein